MTGQALLDKAVSRLGESYILGTLVPKDDPDWHGPWDCAEYLSWVVYQVTGRLYGCVDNSVKPSQADAYTGAWAQDAEDRGQIISVQQAAGTPGAAVLRKGTQYTTGHIVLSDGKGGTVEAKGAHYGVVRDTLSGRSWNYGILVPWVEYEKIGQPEPAKPEDIYRLTYPHTKDPIVKAIQIALYRHGFDPGPWDSIFGYRTYNAVISFQKAKGLVVDGEVGPQTMRALGMVS